MRRVRSDAKTFASIAAIWLLVAVFAALRFDSLVPRSAVGFIGLLVFGPPLYLLGELLSDWLWSTKVAQAISEHPSPAARILGGIVIGVAFLALLLAGASVFSRG